MHVKLFVKQDCPRCPAAKHACEGIDSVQIFDVGDVDGLAEAAFHSVLATPTVLVIDADGHEVAGWRGDPPTRADVASAVGV